MAENATTWTPRRAWAGLLADGHHGVPGKHGVTVVARERLGIASLIGKEGGESALAQALKARFRLDLPTTSTATQSATHALLWAGPGQWLLTAETRGGFDDDMRSLARLAAVSEQSDGKAVLRLSGDRIREALAKGCMVDLHPSAFPVDAVALTSIAYVGVHLRRAADGPEGAVFDIMVARSMAGSFWSWLSASAAEFGCTVTTGRG